MPGRPLIFGEVLFDVFPDGRRILGGAPFNVAWHLQGLGERPLFITRVGEDDAGREILAHAEAWGLDTAGFQRDPDHPTGRVQVSLDAGEPAYEIVPNQAYDYIDSDRLPELRAPNILVHGTLAARERTSRGTLEILRARVAAPILVDVNLRPPWWRVETVAPLLDGASLLKLNEHELAQLAPEGDTLDAQVTALRGAFDLKDVCVTRGERGALLIPTSGERCEIAPAGSSTIVDTVGAGDAFTAVLVLGAIRAWPTADTLARAQSFAAAVVAIPGAVPDTPDFYRPFTDRWNLP